MADLAMDPRLVAALARARLRAAVVATVVRAGADGLAEADLLVGLRRVVFAGATQQDIEWVMRSLERDGLLLTLAGRVRLGPAALTWLRNWSAERIAATAPEAKA